MFPRKIIRLTLIISILLSVSSVHCKKKGPTSPDVDDLTKPVIWLSLSQISYTATESGPNPSDQKFQAKNSGKGTLNYTITDDAEWLSCAPPSGSSTGNVIEHTVTVDIKGLKQGTYGGKITIACADATNSPQIMNVGLKVDPPLTNNEISISCDPGSGFTGTLVTISVKIKGNSKEIKAFGLEFTFSTAMFEYQSVSKGDLTEGWTSVGGNVVSSGTVRVGGYAGGASPIPKWSIGSIVKVILKVTGSGCTDGQQSQINIQNCIDDIAGMAIESPSITFTYKK